MRRPWWRTSWGQHGAAEPPPLSQDTAEWLKQIPDAVGQQHHQAGAVEHLKGSPHKAGWML